MARTRMVRFNHVSGEALVNPSRVAFATSSQVNGQHVVDIGFHHRGWIHMQRFTVQNAAVASAVLNLVQTATDDDDD